MPVKFTCTVSPKALRFPSRLMRIAEDLDARIAKLRASFGDIGDTRLTIMAALALADEL